MFGQGMVGSKQNYIIIIRFVGTLGYQTFDSATLEFHGHAFSTEDLQSPNGQTSTAGFISHAIPDTGLGPRVATRVLNARMSQHARLVFLY